MIFSEQFINSIADDPAGAVVKIIDYIQEIFQQDGAGWDDKDENEALLEGYTLLQSIVQSFDLRQLGEFPHLSGQIKQDNQTMWLILKRYRDTYLPGITEMRAGSMVSRFNAMLGSRFSYEFSKGDLERIQKLLNELRESIRDCREIENEHKQRLMRRLEKLQSELHKKMSDLDRFWGLVGDAGVILGKLGENAKPFVDRIKEIADIVWRTQSRAEELPSDTPPPLLQSNEDAE